MFHGIYATIESAWHTPARRIFSLIWLVAMCIIVPFVGMQVQALGWLAGLLGAAVFISMLYGWTSTDLQKLFEQRRDHELKNERGDEQ